MNNKRLEFLADASMLSIALIWGSTFIIVKQAVEMTPPVAFNTLRFFVAAVSILPFVYLRRKNINWQSIKQGLTLGVVLFLIFTLQTIGIKYSSASVAGFLTGLYVLFVPIMSSLFYKMIPHPMTIVGAFLATVGMLLTGSTGSLNFTGGEWLVMGGAFFIAVQIILTDKFSKESDVVLLSAFQIITAFLLGLGYNLIFEPSLLPEDNTLYFWGSVIGTGVFATVICFLVQTAMQKYTTPSKAAVFFTMEPVSSAFFSFLIVGEVLSGRQYSGAGLIVAAILLAEFGTILKHKKS